ncbi:hypothetical protein AAHA92_31351 [Salvia divinorum]|uniref:Peptidase M16 C-terminal domain-containing protein n=1 Tax=Salvia divinorum TaxID=28513 RepID=A0ABD1FTV3_SALDI
MFDSIATLAVAQNMRELYRLVLVDGSFFFLPDNPWLHTSLNFNTALRGTPREEINGKDLDDMNIEIIRNTLYKAYLKDFYRFYHKLGGATAEIIIIGTELTREDRRKLYSNFGLLYPYGPEELAMCEDTKQVINYIPSYVLS